MLVYTMPKLFHIIPKRLAAQGFDIASPTTCLQRHVERPPE